MKRNEENTQLGLDRMTISASAGNYQLTIKITIKKKRESKQTFDLSVGKLFQQ